MKLARFTFNAHTSIGLARGNHIIELSKVLPSAPSTISGIFAGGAALRDQINAGLSNAPQRHPTTLPKAERLLT